MAHTQKNSTSSVAPRQAPRSFLPLSPWATGVFIGQLWFDQQKNLDSTWFSKKKCFNKPVWIQNGD